MRLIDAEQMEKHIMESKVFNQYFKELVQSLIWGENTVDVVPVMRGEWIENPTKDSVLCSYCHADWNLFDNDTYRFCYCPNCGAKMEDKP